MAGGSGRSPGISVVIPTLGRYELLSRVLERLAQPANRRGVTDVIVVADAAEPRLAAVEAVVGGGGHGARLMTASRPGASAARNAGWRAASGELVLFIDNDTLPHPELVAQHRAWHLSHGDDRTAVLGHVRWARELRVTPFMKWLERGIQFDYAGIKGVEAGWGRFYTANVSLPRALLETVDGFDEEGLPYLYEDLDLAYRLSHGGLRLLYNRGARVEHLHGMDIETWRQRLPILASAERAFCAKHPEIAPYFHDLFERHAERPRARGRLAPLIKVVPPRFPVLGPMAWRSADAFYGQALAADFLRAWDAADAS